MKSKRSKQSTAITSVIDLIREEDPARAVARADKRTRRKLLREIIGYRDPSEVERGVQPCPVCAVPVRTARLQRHLQKVHGHATSSKARERGAKETEGPRASHREGTEE